MIAIADLFPRCSIEVLGAPRMSGFRILCSKCGVQDKVSAQRANLPIEAIAKIFSGRGWSVSARNAAHHVCPKCQEKRTKVAPMTSSEKPIAVELAPPREMSREDRRIVFAKLNDVYLDERAGYSNGWSDQRVADDLSIPRAWVKSIREENFGPDGASEEIRAMLEQAIGVIGEARKHQDEIARMKVAAESLLKRAATLEAQTTPLLTIANRIEGQVARITKMVGA